MSGSIDRRAMLAEALCRLVRNVPGLTMEALRAHPALAGLTTDTVDAAVDIATGPGTPAGWLLAEDALGVLLAVRVEGQAA